MYALRLLHRTFQHEYIRAVTAFTSLQTLFILVNLKNIYMNSIRTSQQTHYVSATKPNRLMLFREIIAVYCENHTEQRNTPCGQKAEL
jgi:hypothetical protein